MNRGRAKPKMSRAMNRGAASTPQAPKSADSRPAFRIASVTAARATKPTEANGLLADVEAFCQAIRPVEELCYVEHRFNDQFLPLARKHGILAMPVPVQYGGRGADTATYSRALVRIGREGTGVRTF